MEDCYKSRGVPYANGEVVTVEFDPTKKVVVFSVDGANPRRFEQPTNIEPTSTEQIHFCVYLYTAQDDISICQ